MFYEHLWWLFDNQDIADLNAETAWLLGIGLCLFVDKTDTRRADLTHLYNALFRWL